MTSDGAQSRNDPAPRFHVDAEPSTLFSVWADTETPLEEEVRLALQSAFPGTEVTGDLESTDGVLFGSVYRIPGHAEDLVLWVEEKGDLAESLEEGLEHPSDLERVQGARYVLGVETLLDREHLQDGFLFQLRVAVEATVPGLAAIFDDNALVVRPPGVVRSLVQARTPPRPGHVYAIHVVSGSGGFWLHTHGLSRCGVAEFDLVGVPADDVREGHDLIDALVDAVLGGAVPDENDIITLGRDLAVRVVSLEDAMRRVPEDSAGGRRDREGDMADHGGGRFVIFDAQRDEPPLDVLRRFADTGVVFKSAEETRRQSSFSRERFGVFGQLFAIHRHQGWRFHVKLAFEDPARSGSEHVWFEVSALSPGRVQGRLLTPPHSDIGLTAGHVDWFDLQRLTDWLIVTPRGTFDPEAAASLLEEFD